MKHVCVALAEGFEEIEGLTVVDLLRRSGILVTTASISDDLKVTGAHNISVMADVLFSQVNFSSVHMLVLPGGMPGTHNLQNHVPLCNALKAFIDNGKEIAAICAAPMVLGSLGLLNGKQACCYPGFEDQLTGAKVCYDPVVEDKQVITSRGMGTAIAFSLALIRRLKDAKTADEISKSIVNE